MKLTFRTCLSVMLALGLLVVSSTADAANRSVPRTNKKAKMPEGEVVDLFQGMKDGRLKVDYKVRTIPNFPVPEGMIIRHTKSAVKKSRTSTITTAHTRLDTGVRAPLK